jgi:arylsulfatase
MGYRTPNIDRIANEGMLFTDEKDFPALRKRFGPHGVRHCWADGKGGQRIENTGPLTRKRMETVDEEFLAAAKTLIKKQHEAGTPFFVWFNTTHMHFRTHAKPSSLASRAGGNRNTTK